MITIDSFLGGSSDCLILVHPSISVLEHHSVEIQAHYQFLAFNVGKELSQALMNTLLTDRGRAAQGWFMDRINENKPGPLLCDQIGLLFEPSLQLNSLSLFQQAARITRLIILWPGDYSSGVLTYAVPEHAHYQAWRQIPHLIQIVRLSD